MNDKLQSTIEPNYLPTISHFSLSQLVIISLVIFGNIWISNINLKCMHFEHHCCCLTLIYKSKRARQRRAARQRRMERITDVSRPHVHIHHVHVHHLLQDVRDRDAVSDILKLDKKQEVENGPENEKMNRFLERMPGR